MTIKNIAILGYAHPFGEDLFYGAERIIYYLILELKHLGYNCVIFSVKGCNLPGFEYIPMEKQWDDTRDIYYDAVKNYEKVKGIKFDIVHSFQASGSIYSGWRNEYIYCLEPFFRFLNTKENIIAYSKLLNKLNNGQSTVIYFGIPDINHTINNKADDYLIWIGRCDAGKAPHNAIEVAKRAGRRIILMCPSYDYSYFINKIYPEIDNDKVIWLRGVDDEIKRRVMMKAYAFINPIWNNYHEMFGIVNIEALSCGVPIIAWGNSAQPSAVNFNGGEIFSNGVQGFIVEHNMYSEDERQKAIEKSVNLLKNIKDIDRNACYQLFKNRFTSEIMAKKTINYYNKLSERRIVYDITEEI